MAGDWLKVEKDTPEKPEILAMATDLGLDPEIVFAKCFKVWRWADSHTADGNAQNVTARWLDAHVHTPRFSDALVKVGWLIVRASSLQFPNFEQHMGQSGKRRALRSQQQRERREAFLKPSNGLKPASREEKRRDKEIKKESESFIEFWKIYPRRERKSEALRCWNARIGEGVSEPDLVAAATNYATACQRENRELKHIMQPTTFLGPNRRFSDWENVSQLSSQKPSDWHDKAGKRVSDMTIEEKNFWNVPVGI